MDFIKNFKGSKQKFEWIKIINSKLIFIIFILSALTGCGGGGGTDEINIVQPIETAAQKSMSTMNDIAKFLRLEVAQKAESEALISSALTSSNQYVPAAGDIMSFGYHDTFKNATYSYTLDTKNSTSDTLVYNENDVNDDIGKALPTQTMTVTKTANGILVKHSYDEFSLEYVLGPNSVDVAKVAKDGTKTAEERLVPGASTDSFEAFSADGSQIIPYTNVSVVKK